MSEAQRIVERIERNRGWVWFTDPPSLSATDDQPSPPTLDQWTSAETTVKGISFAPKSPDEIGNLSHFNGLRALMLIGNTVTDDALAQIPIMERLDTLTIISSSRFTGEGIKYLKDLPSLSELKIILADHLCRSSCGSSVGTSE
ncbi:MAG: hypothetical protein ABGX07_10340 [Pirellulaceae bacterium]